VTQTITKPVGPISAREFIDLRAWREEENGIIVFGGSQIEHPKYPTDTPSNGCVRGVNGPSGYIITPLKENQARVIYIITTDIKGWIPKAIVDTAIISSIEQGMVSIEKQMKNLASKKST